MQTISTKYFGPTDHRGSRIKASKSYGKNVYWHDYDYSMNTEENHREAAKQLLIKLNWESVSGSWIMGGTKDGYIFVNNSETFYCIHFGETAGTTGGLGLL